MDLNLSGLAGVSAESIKMAQEVLKAGPDATIMSMLSAANVQKDYPSGIVAYNLESVVHTLQPVITPLRNMLPRTKGKGGASANWKQITSLATNDGSPFTAFGTKANVVTYTAIDRSATYKNIAKGDNINIQAMLQARGLEDDAKAKMTLRLLTNVFILEERALIGGRNAALGTVTAPTNTTATTGGTIAAATYYVVVRAVTAIANPGTTQSRGKKSTQTAQITTGSTSTISASTPAVDGAVAYEWYVGTANDNTSGKLEAVTYINSVKLTSLAGTGITVQADNSADTYAFDGLLSQGSGTGFYGNFGYSKALATGTPGTGTTFAITDINDMLLSLFQNYGADPEVLLMNPQQAVDYTSKVIASGQLRFVVPDNGPIGKLTGGYRATGHINPVTGREIMIVSDPWWPQGTIMALSLSVPVPLGEITNALEVETQLDYFQLEYAMTSPKYEIEIMTLEALKGYFLLGAGIISNIAAG